MLEFTNLGIILEKTDRPFENQAVLNPGCLLKDGIVHMVYRAVQNGNYSSVGYAQLKDNKVVYRSPEPLLRPTRASERHGIEDPRLIECEGMYYLFYTVFDGTDAQVAYATADTLTEFKKQKIISARITYAELHTICQHAANGMPYNYLCTHYNRAVHPEGQVILWEKDAMIFPRKIGGRFAMLHRIKPEIQIVRFDDFDQLTTRFWRKELANLQAHTLMVPEYWFESGYIGGGCPPIETEDGWLLIYHAVQSGVKGATYRAAAALLDISTLKVKARLPYPLFSPEAGWERVGDVHDVVFPTGAITESDLLTIYYGAADSRIAAKSVPLKMLLRELSRYLVT